MSERDVRVAILVAAIVIAIAASWIAVTAIAGPPQTSGGGTRPDGEFIAIPTVPHPNGDGCRLALLAGTLTVHPVWGIAVRGENEPQLVFWPKGWSAHRTDDGGAALLDRQGHVVAHTGDEVRSAGGMMELGGREGFAVCSNGLHFEPAQP